MDTTKKPVLVLNASYEPINVCAARRALTLLIKGHAKVEETRDSFVHRDYQLPSVIRLVQYHQVPVRKQVVSRRNIYLRDRYLCQYCGDRFPTSELTLDHVIPKSRGGKTTWENLVTACCRCNHRKRDRTPEEANMPLFRQPRAMSGHTHRHLLRSEGAEDEKWQKYLYY